MQPVYQQHPAQSVIGHDRHQVVDGRDERTGRDRRVHLDLLEEQRDQRADGAGDHHGDHQRNADTARNRKGKQKVLVLEQSDIQAHKNHRNAAEQESVEEAHTALLQDKMHLLTEGQVLVHQDADRHRQRLRAHVTCHVQDQRLERHDHGEALHHCLKRADDRRYQNAETEQGKQPRQTLLHAAQQRLLQVLLGGQACQLGVVLAHLVVHDLDHALGGDDTQKLVAVIEHGHRRLGVVLQLFDTVVDALVGVDIRKRRDDQVVERRFLFGGDQIAQLHGAVELIVLVHHKNRGDVVILLRLTHQLRHRLGHAQIFAQHHAVGRHLAADLVLVKGREQANIAAHILRQRVDDQGALFFFDPVQDIDGGFGVELFGNCRRLLDVHFVKIGDGVLFLQMLKRLRQHVGGADAKQLFALGERQRSHRLRNIVAVIILELLLRRLGRSRSADDCDYFVFIVRSGGYRFLHRDRRIVDLLCHSRSSFSFCDRKEHRKIPAHTHRDRQTASSHEYAAHGNVLPAHANKSCLPSPSGSETIAVRQPTHLTFCFIFIV